MLKTAFTEQWKFKCVANILLVIFVKKWMDKRMENKKEGGEEEGGAEVVCLFL